ncbi:MAG: Uma2 family endonuclease [Gemmatimonadota bacterium]|nr:MAG: Uma2 family endonuclease [Gemmatimonadota bacterium]
MSGAKLMTAEELLREQPPHKRSELIRGRLVVREPAGGRHGAVTMQIALPLASYVKERDLGRVYAAETGFKIESDPDTVRAPDVAFIVKARVPEEEPRGYPAYAPDLVVEVLGADDRPGEVLAKVGAWLNAGVRLVWVVDPSRKIARVYRADGGESLLECADSLRGGDVVPGFELPLEDLW